MEFESHNSMPCRICGSKTKNPNSTSHLKTIKHQKAADERRKYIFKIAVIGGNGSGRTSFVQNVIGYSFNSICNMPAFPIDFKTFHPQVNETKDKPFEPTIQIWDLLSMQYIRPRLLHMLFLGSRYSVLVFDTTKYESFKEALNWLIMMMAFQRTKIPFVIVGNKIDLIPKTKGETADLAFGEYYSYAYSYLFNFYIDYLHTSSHPSETELTQNNKELFARIAELLAYEFENENTVFDKTLKEYPGQNRYILGWIVSKMEDSALLRDILVNETNDFRLRIIALKRLNEVKQEEIQEIDKIPNKDLQSAVYLFSLDQESLYQAALAGENIFIRTVALDLLVDQEKLLEFAVGHKDPVFRMIALSKLHGEEYYDFVQDMYQGNDIEKQIILEHIGNDKFLFELISDKSTNSYQMAKALGKIKTPKYLQILRLIGPQDLQPLILSRLKEISHN